MRQYWGCLLLLVTATVAAWAQVGATISSDDVPLKAGETFHITITLDKAPSFSGGVVQAIIADPHKSGMGVGCSPNQTDRRKYDCRFQIPATALGGVWNITNLQFIEGMTTVNLKFNPISVRVIPTPDLEFPTSAEVTVNLDQAQLLRREANRLE
jgi:hypothetical protein